jgi:hypothetical protein
LQARVASEVPALHSLLEAVHEHVAILERVVVAIGWVPQVAQ